MQGIFKPIDFKEGIPRLSRKGFDRGISTGHRNVEDYYRIKLGMMTIVTGTPGSGKSELIDDFCIRLARREGWKFAYFSPENYPLEEHYSRLCERWTGISFHNLDAAALSTCEKWISEHFTWIYPDEEKEPISLDTILEKARYLSELEGLDGLIIDPYNELEHNMGNMSETTYISQFLSKVRRFARKHEIHVWIIAHPTKLQKDKTTGQYPVPTLYDISGSANWRNKADFGLVVHRPNMLEHKIALYVQKVKFKHLGKLGECSLKYIFENGRFEDV